MSARDARALSAREIGLCRAAVAGAPGRATLRRAFVRVLLAVAIGVVASSFAAGQTDDPIQALGNVPRHGSFGLVP